MGLCKSKESSKKDDRHGSIYNIFRLLSNRDHASQWRKRHNSIKDIDIHLDEFVDKKIHVNKK